MLISKEIQNQLTNNELYRDQKVWCVSSEVGVNNQWKFDVFNVSVYLILCIIQSKKKGLGKYEKIVGFRKEHAISIYIGFPNKFI